MATTPPVLEALDVAPVPLMVLELAPTEPVDLGDSESAWLAFPDVGVVAGVCASEFFREDFFDDRVVADGGPEFPLPRLRFLMMSVLRDKGRVTPCSFRNNPQALQRGWPSGLRRQRGVVCVKQLVQVVAAPPSPGL
jgi:hypothetical protein